MDNELKNGQEIILYRKNFESLQEPLGRLMKLMAQSIREDIPLDELLRKDMSK